jgi:hypothetical protein
MDAYDLRLRHHGSDDGDAITRSLDLNTADVDVTLLALLKGAIERSGGDVRDIAEYDLEIREHGSRYAERYFAAHPGEVQQ